MSKWPMYAVLLGGLLLLGILVYSVNFAHNQEEEKPLLMGQGQGLALAPPSGSAALAVPQAGSGAKREPLIVVQGGGEQSDQYRQELENLRRMKAQAQLTALSAPLGVKKASDTAAKPAPATNSMSL